MIIRLPGITIVRKHNKQFLKHNAMLWKHNTMFLKHNTIFSKHTEQKIIETQHKINETQHKIFKTQHNIYWNTIINTELMCDYTTYNPAISQPLSRYAPNLIPPFM